MWRLVPSLTLVSLAFVTAAPQQHDLNLDSPIDQVFPSATTPQPVPQIVGDLEQIIQEFFSNVTTTSTPRTIHRTTPTTPTTLHISYRDIIDCKFISPCPHYLETCCKPPDIQEKTTPLSTERIGCGVRHPDGVGFRIPAFDTNEAQFGEFPWMVAILNEETIGPESRKLNIYLCGGALIHRRAILTAAHCVKSKQPQDLKIRAGEWDPLTRNEILPHQDRNVERVVVHENFSVGLHNDFALLILKEPVEYAENVDVVCLPEMNAVFDGSRCLASGWRKDVFGNEGRYQAILKKVELPVVPRDRCQDTLRTTRLGKNFVLDKSFICAGGEVGKDTCEAAGGSPLVCPLASDPKRYVQAGIVAWGLGCGEDGIPAVYANVAVGRRWIDEQMAFYNLDNTVYQYPSQSLD